MVISIGKTALPWLIQCPSHLVKRIGLQEYTPWGSTGGKSREVAAENSRKKHISVVSIQIHSSVDNGKTLKDASGNRITTGTLWNYLEFTLAAVVGGL